MKNSWGADAHPSDYLVHYTDFTWTNTETFAQKNQQLRAAWDIIHATPELASAYEMLVESEKNVALRDYADDHDWREEYD